METLRPGIAHSGAVSRIDLIGALASSLCAAHCAAIPLALALFPLSGLDFLDNHTFDFAFAGLAVVLGVFAVWRGIERHRQAGVVVWLLLAAVLLGLGLTVFNDGPWHVGALVAGGCALAWTHVVNLRLLHRCVAEVSARSSIEGDASAAA